MSWYVNGLKIPQFNGRAHRKEGWMVVLFDIIAAIIAMMLVFSEQISESCRMNYFIALRSVFPRF